MCTSTKEMSVASWQKVGAIDLITKDVPVIKPGEVLVRVAASGICGNLLRIFLL
jgi:threonine dehydrogenase-like Zn-dependent dehydrogenase